MASYPKPQTRSPNVARLVRGFGGTETDWADAILAVTMASSFALSTNSRIFVSGHRGLVGSSIVRALRASGYSCVLTADRAAVDLTDQRATSCFLADARPDVVVLAAAKVGGIRANWEQPWEFLCENLQIETNVIAGAFAVGVRRLVFLGSSCIYPRDAEQPLKEEALLSGPLEETNRAYAVAKIAGIEMCRSLNREYDTDYISLMPTNLYGPGDNFDLSTSHVLPALIRKFHEAKANGHAPVRLWGRGVALREFLHVDDLGEAVVFCLERVHATDVPDGILNVGCGSDLSIRDLAGKVQEVVGHRGPVEWDASMPDGTPRKLMDSGRLRTFGWRPRISLDEGLASTYNWYVANVADHASTRSE